MILRQKIYRANGVIVTIQQHTNPDAVVDQMARGVERWREEGNLFANILLQQDRAPRNKSCVRQQGSVFLSGPACRPALPGLHFECLR